MGESAAAMWACCNIKTIALIIPEAISMGSRGMTHPTIPSMTEEKIFFTVRFFLLLSPSKFSSTTASLSRPAVWMKASYTSLISFPIIICSWSPVNWTPATDSDLIRSRFARPLSFKFSRKRVMQWAQLMILSLPPISSKI